MEKAGEVGEGLKDAGKTVVDKIIHPIETTKEVGHGIKELAVAGAGVNAYGNNVDGFTTEKHVTAVTNAATDIADAGMGVNSYGTNVDMK